MSLRPATRLGPYQIDSHIGSGGMGEVYRATELALGRPVAIKVLPDQLADHPGRLRRFTQEARSASALNHPNIVTIYTIGCEGACHYIAMELVEGETVKTRLARGRLDVREVVRLATQIADGLAKAHAAGIVHRDLKPDNLMVTADGLVKILDFGLAKLAAPDDGSGLSRAETRTPAPEQTLPGAVLGTVGYMSPEQARGRPVDHRSDQFSFGAILYELATGRRAFWGETSVETLSAIIRDDPPPLVAASPQMPPAIGAIVARCLAKAPEGRYDSTRALAADLRSVQDVRSGVWEPAPRTGATGAHETGRGASIAVLPFADMSAQRDQEYFCEGVAEELIAALSAVDGLRVAARTSAFQFRGRSLDISEVGRRLKVGAVLEGSVRKAGSRLRVTTRLVDVADGFDLWSGRYDRDLDDVFAVQDEIAQTIVSKLKVTLLRDEADRTVPIPTRRHTENAQAYQDYLKGRYCWNKRTREGFFQAIGHFEDAVGRDPAYALAYAGLADTYNVLGYYNSMPPTEAYPKGKAAAARALDVEDTLAEAHASLGFARLFYDWDGDGAQAALRRAIELNPGYGTAQQWYGWVLLVRGRFTEALEVMRRAVELDPLSLVINDHLGYALSLAGRHDAAVEQLQRTVQLHASYPLTHWRLGSVYLEAGRLDEATRAFQQAVDLTDGRLALGYLGLTHARAGREPAARAALGRLATLASSRYVSPLEAALVHAELGATDDAFACLDQAHAQRVSDVARLHLLPWPAALRDDPRFAARLRRIGLAPENV